MSTGQLLALRQHLYRRTPGRQVETYEDVRAFLDEVGILLPWDRAGIELPSVRGAMVGPFAREPGPAWEFKDRLVRLGHAVYGELLAGAHILLHPRLFPAFYAASGRAGEADEYLDAYRLGGLSANAKRIIDVLRWQPPLATAALRAAVDLDGQDGRRDFARALSEAQQRLYVLPVGVTPESDRNYSYYWGLVDQHFAQAVEAAAELPAVEASRDLLTTYIETVVFAHRRRVARFFGWPAARFNSALELAGGAVTVVEALDGQKGPWLVARRALG